MRSKVDLGCFDLFFGCWLCCVVRMTRLVLCVLCLVCCTYCTQMPTVDLG